MSIVRSRARLLKDSDDDGEAAAGGRLLHLLQMVDARNVVVVVRAPLTSAGSQAV